MTTLPAGSRAEIRAMVAPYQGSQTSRSIWQIVNTFVPLIAIWALMYWSLSWSYAITLGLSLIGGGLVMRVFIIQHDCGHGAFFRSRRINALVGSACSLITLTPYASWRRQHAGHHGHWNNLDKRDNGVDIYSTCLTVEEYEQQSWLGRWKHRLLRHPLVSLVLLPPLVFLLLYRLPFDMPRSWRWERRGVYLTNIAMLVVAGLTGWALGFGAMLMVQLPVMLLAAIVGVWLFSVQHRFENTLWASQQDWSAINASLRGSSYLRLPRLLQWFTGNIGFHHIHHLSPQIPNYRLQECHDANPLLQQVPTLTLRSGVMAWRFVLWDRARGKMVRFAHASARPAA